MFYSGGDLHCIWDGAINEARQSSSKPLAGLYCRRAVRPGRVRLREQGLRPIQIWVPDVWASPFKSEAHRQSLAVALGVHAHDDQAFIDTVADWSNE